MSAWYSFYQSYAAELLLAALVLLVLLLLWLLIVQAQLGALRRRLRGSGGGPLPATMPADDPAAQIRWLAGHLALLDERLKRQSGAVGMVRYNPFRDTGGDQSFSVAWLNEQQDGLVLSSLYSRQETRLYAKPVQGGASTYTLTEEEQRALQAARETWT